MARGVFISCVLMFAVARSTDEMLHDPPSTTGERDDVPDDHTFVEDLVSRSPLIYVRFEKGDLLPVEVVALPTRLKQIFSKDKKGTVMHLLRFVEIGNQHEAHAAITYTFALISTPVLGRLLVDPADLDKSCEGIDETARQRYAKQIREWLKL